MTDIASRYPGIGVCPVCGAPASGVGRSGAYCAGEHYAEARHRALAGIAWEPAPGFADSVRRRAVADQATTTKRKPKPKATPASVT